jgi:transcriptional regulator with XRE-family HTH domain
MNLLKTLIQASGLNQKEFAQKVGRHPAHISRQKINGGNITFESFLEYAQIVGVSELKFTYKSVNVKLTLKSKYY